MFLRSLVKLNIILFRSGIILYQSGILPPNSGEDQKQGFAAFWIHLGPEFRISCCQVGITCQKTEGPDIFRPPQC